MEGILTRLNDYVSERTSIFSLVVFRIFFGLLLFYSSVRSLLKGWVSDLYIAPTFHFPFVSWITPLEGVGMYVVFGCLCLCALGIALGVLYRLSAASFFLLFTYVELLDKAYYLNHYYLVSLLCFWLTLVPAHRYYSIDTLLFPSIRSASCARWHILIFKVQLSIVYFFAGLAKVNTDWLFQAQPMATWLPGKYSIPVLGNILHLKTTAFLFSWAGCLYDLFIWVFLWMKRTRGWAYFFVILFHVLTAILFPRIGMFPFIMITSTLIFFSPGWQRRTLGYFPFFKIDETTSRPAEEAVKMPALATVFLVLYLAVQLYLPLRYLGFSGHLFWHEQGYRFSWRVMLMEKNGFTSIIIKDPRKGTQKEVDQDQYLTPFQQQQMKSQPDLILQFASAMGDQFQVENGYAPAVYVKSKMSLNGRRSIPFTNPLLDVYGSKDPMKEGWILPFSSQ